MPGSTKPIFAMHGWAAPSWSQPRSVAPICVARICGWQNSHYRRPGLRADRRFWLALCVLRRHSPSVAAFADPPWYGRTRALPGGARATSRARHGSPRSPRRGPRISPLRAAAIVQQRVAVQHVRGSALRSRHFAGDLDHRDLAAHDPELDARKGRHQRGGGGSDYWPQHDAVGYRRDLRLRLLRLYRRSDRTAPDGGILQCWNLGPRSNSVLSRQHNGAVPVFATDLRVLRVGRFFRPRRLYSRAIPHTCARHRGLVLQWRRPCHQELRAAGSRPPGCSVWRELQQTRRADDLLCPPEHLCDVSRPRDPRRPAATLTEKGPRRGPGGDCEWRHSRHLVDQAVELTGIL